MTRNRTAPAVGDRIADARETVRRERRLVADERAAFDAFVARLDDLAVRDHVRHRVPVRALTGETATGARAVERAYRETVMSVPHYDDVYGDTFDESVRVELGPDAAGALDGTLGPAGKRALVNSATEARNVRTRFLDTIDAEDRVLAETGATLEAVAGTLRGIEDGHGGRLDGSFDGLVTLRAELVDLRERCDAVADRRQGAIHASVPGRDAPDLAVFLYDGYPVLAAVADLADRIDAAIRATDRAIAHAR